jgi:hypothetical protein
MKNQKIKEELTELEMWWKLDGSGQKDIDIYEQIDVLAHKINEVVRWINSMDEAMKFVQSKDFQKLIRKVNKLG